MKKFYLIFWHLLVTTIVESVNVDLVSREVKEIALSQYVKNSIKFDIFIYGRMTCELSKIASQVVMMSNESFAFKI